MSNWYYYNQDGERIGPLTSTALKLLCQQGVVTTETVIENSNGRASTAGQVRGLEFPIQNAASDQAIVPPVSEEVYGMARPTSRTTPFTEPKSLPAFQSIAGNPFVNVTAKPIAVPQSVFVSDDPETKKSYLPLIVAGIGFILIGTVFCLLFFETVHFLPFGKSSLSSVTKFVEYVIRNEGDILDFENGWTENDVDKFLNEKFYWNARHAAGKEKNGTWVPKPGFENTCELSNYFLSHKINLIHYAKENAMGRSMLKKIHGNKLRELIRLSIEEIESKGDSSHTFDVYLKRGEINDPSDISRTVLHAPPDIPPAIPAIMVPGINAQSDQAKIDQFIAEHGSDVKAVDKDGKTLLHKAVKRQGNLAVVKYLVSQGADVNAQTAGTLAGSTPLHEAMAGSDIEIVKFLVSQGANVNAKGVNDISPLYEAASYENVEIVKFLVSQGADVNAKRKSDLTPLHEAARFEKFEIVKFLVSQGADVNAKASFWEKKYTPLHYAARSNRNIDVIKFLISEGADMNAEATGLQDFTHGYTPLHVAAAENKNVEVIKFLVSVGDVNVKTKNNDVVTGVTPLLAATRAENVEAAKCLISLGADIDARDSVGVSPRSFGVLKLVSDGK